MRKPATRLSLLALAVLLLLLAGCGGKDEQGNGRKVQANETDLAFATDMLIHHELGIDAADLARTRAQAPLIRRAARELIQLQAVETQVLRTVRRVLSEAGVEKGDLGVPQTTLDPEELRRAEDFDRAYADAMIAHQEVAIRMSAVERRDGVHAELRRMAGDITDLARFQIKQLERWRSRR